MVSVKELAQLSDAAYELVDYKGWKITKSERKYIKILEYEIDWGFKAALYEQDGRKVIAYAGSNDLKDYANDDGYIVYSLIPPQAAEALKFFDEVYGKNFEIKPGVDNYNRFADTPELSDIVLTGHSLGGALAAIVANKYAAFAVTFNAPGTDGLKIPFFRKWDKGEEGEVRHDDDNYDRYALILSPSKESKERIRQYTTGYDPVSFGTRNYRKGFGKIYAAAPSFQLPRVKDPHTIYQWIDIDRYDADGDFDASKKENQPHY